MYGGYNKIHEMGRKYEVKQLKNSQAQVLHKRRKDWILVIDDAHLKDLKADDL